MWLGHYVLGMEKKCSNSQKSNDSILLVYLIVSTRQENCGLKARSDSVFEIVLLSFFFFFFFAQSECFSFKKY